MQANDPALIDPPLLEVLLDAREPMSVEALALRRGVSPATVLTELDRLRAAGCAFDEHPQHGLRLTQAGLSTWADYLRHTVGDDRPIEVYRRIGSTQDACRRLITTYGARGDGALVATHEQTAGRGRFGRTWTAPPGATLTFSRACMIDRPRAGSTVDRVTFAASVAIASAAETLLEGHARVQIKWPNDVCIGGRKLAGILVETCELDDGGRAAVLGIGLNVSLRPADVADADPALADRVTSLALHGAAIDRLRVLGAAAAALDTALRDTEMAALLEAWRARCTQFEQPIRVRCDGRLVAGRVIDIDPREGLIVRSDSGEIIHLPAATTTVV